MRERELEDCIYLMYFLFSYQFEFRDLTERSCLKNFLNFKYTTMLTLGDKLKLVRIATCIIVCYVIIAILQEKMFKRPYGIGESAEKFEMAIAYVGVQCFAYAIISGGIFITFESFKYQTKIQCH